VARQMHDAGLDWGIGKGCRNNVRKAFEPIHDRDQNILNPAVLQLVHDREPEFGAFALGDLKPKNLAHAVA